MRSTTELRPSLTTLRNRKAEDTSHSLYLTPSFTDRAGAPGTEVMRKNVDGDAAHRVNEFKIETEQLLQRQCKEGSFVI